MKKEKKTTQKQQTFYRMVFMIVFPIVLQNLVNTCVASADVVMLGYVNQTALTASSLANQLYGILSFMLYGIASGSSILVSQYWGKRDLKTIERVLGIALRLACGFALIGSAAALLIPRLVMKIYSNDAAVIDIGAQYMRIIGVTYLFGAISQMYLHVQRCIERVRLSSIVLSLSLIINVVLNACFIFGLFGLPKLGLIGVAVATVIARAFELIVCIVDSIRNKLVKIRFRYLFERNKVLFSDFMRYSLPALCNDIVASIGFSGYSAIMGHLGSDVVAANSVASMMRSFGNVLSQGCASGCAIILGKTLGENKLELSKVYAKRFLYLALGTGLIGTAIMLLGRPLFLKVGNLEGQALDYLSIMLFINSYYVVGMALNTTWIGSIFRAGGDAKFGFLCDLFTIWVWNLPLGALFAFVIKLPAIWVYFFLMLDEFVKMPFVYRHYKKYGWVKNITREMD